MIIRSTWKAEVYWWWLIKNALTLHLSSTILRKASRSTTEEEDSKYFSNYLWLFRTHMPMLRRQDLLWRTVFLLGGKVGIWKQARELVIMSEPKSTGPLILPADAVIQGYIPLGLMQTSSRSRLRRMPHGRHIKDERKEIRLGNFSLGDRNHQTGDAAFTSPRPKTHSTRE